MLPLMLPITSALELGTGGVATNHYYRLRLVDAPSGYYKPIRGIEDPTSIQNDAVGVRHILNVLKLAVTAFSKYMGVSRQAIYDWMSGKPVGAANAAKLDNFARAADIVAAAKVEMSSIVRGRKLAGGKTLFESISAGADGAEVASAFVAMLRNEAMRRREIAARLSSRRTLETTDDAPTVFDE
jgi:transcriptional regulator with XRE-family HTH domain